MSSVPSNRSPQGVRAAGWVTKVTVSFFTLPASYNHDCLKREVKRRSTHLTRSGFLEQRDAPDRTRPRAIRALSLSVMLTGLLGSTVLVPSPVHPNSFGGAGWRLEQMPGLKRTGLWWSLMGFTSTHAVGVFFTESLLCVLGIATGLAAVHPARSVAPVAGRGSMLLPPRQRGAPGIHFVPALLPGATRDRGRSTKTVRGNRWAAR